MPFSRRASPCNHAPMPLSGHPATPLPPLLPSAELRVRSADTPDLLPVVLEPRGFEDLLTQTEFMRRISHQDTHIMDVVSTAKAESAASASKLSSLEKLQAAVAKQIEAPRDQVSATRSTLV